MDAEFYERDAVRAVFLGLVWSGLKPVMPKATPPFLSPSSLAVPASCHLFLLSQITKDQVTFSGVLSEFEEYILKTKPKLRVYRCFSVVVI